MIIDKDHLPIEILTLKCLSHRFVQRYQIIRFIKGRNDQTDKSPHARVFPVPWASFVSCIYSPRAVIVGRKLSPEIAAWFLAHASYASLQSSVPSSGKYIPCLEKNSQIVVTTCRCCELVIPTNSGSVSP